MQALDMIDTPSDKLCLPYQFFVSVAKVSAVFWRKTLLGARVSCYLAAGEVIFRLWSLRNQRCILGDVTSGRPQQLDASIPPPPHIFIVFIRLD